MTEIGEKHRGINWGLIERLLPIISRRKCDKIAKNISCRKRVEDYYFKQKEKGAYVRPNN